MNRPIYTALHSLMIIALFFSLSFIYQACGKKNSAEQDLGDKIEEVAETYTEESFFEDDDAELSSSEEIDYTTEEESTTSYSDDSNISSSSSTSSGSRSSSSSSYTAPSTTYSSSGTFMVIAGNYLLESNAEEMVRKLQNAGYSDAQKVVFDLSQYYTVVAGAYDSRTTADRTSSSLSGKGIDNYVLRRKR